MARTVIEATDPVAGVVVGDAPYSSVALDSIHDPVEVSSTRRETGTGPIGRMLALPDRSLTPIGARAFPVPSVAATFDGGVECRTQVLAELGRLGSAAAEQVLLPLGSAAHAGTGLGGMVEEARRARVVAVDRVWFRSDAQFAQIVLALCGAGAVVAVRDTAPLAPYLHSELIDALDFDPFTTIADPLASEAISANTRRIAWWHHDRVLATDGADWRLGARPLPSISVLLATNRPQFVAPAIERIAAQSHTDVELVLALHGIDAAATDAELHLKRLDVDGRVLELPAGMPLGQVLNSAAAASSGQLITKWDDDDLYGRNHLVDMCLGLRYSKADMVGKAPELIHFTKDNTTILRNHSGFESYSGVIAGGTITMPRVAFDNIGGFPPVPRAVDHYIKRAALDDGLRIYRMHGFGFVLVRHDEGHTWRPPESELTSGTERSWIGVPAVADVITEPQ